LSNTKTRFISIRNDALLGNQLKSIDKYLLMILENRKLLSTKNKNWYTIEIRTKKLKELSLITDGRTLLKSLERLRSFNHIRYDLEKNISTGKDKLPNTSKMKIEIDCSPPFTMVDEVMFNDLKFLETKNIKTDKMRINKPYQITVLYYLLEYYHNPTHGGSRGIASPSRRQLSESITINNETLTEYLVAMHKNMMCEFRQGKLYDFNQRTRNRYLPNTIMHKANEEFIGQNRRRYKIHKKDSYFKLPTDNIDDGQNENKD